MKIVQDNEIDQHRELGSFLDMELNFVTQYLEVLKDAKSEWQVLFSPSFTKRSNLFPGLTHQTSYPLVQNQWAYLYLQSRYEQATAPISLATHSPRTGPTLTLTPTLIHLKMKSLPLRHPADVTPGPNQQTKQRQNLHQVAARVPLPPLHASGSIAARPGPPLPRSRSLVVV